MSTTVLAAPLVEDQPSTLLAYSQHAEPISKGIPTLSVEYTDTLSHSWWSAAIKLKVKVLRKTRDPWKILKSWKRTSELKMEVSLIEEDDLNQVNHHHREKFEAFRNRWRLEGWFSEDNEQHDVTTSLVLIRSPRPAPSQSDQNPQTQADGPAFTDELYICIGGLTRRRDVIAFHALLSQKRIRDIYHPLKICFDEASVDPLAAEAFTINLDQAKLPYRSLCGTLVYSITSKHVSTLGGILTIGDTLCAVTTAHEPRARNNSKARDRRSKPTIEELLDAAIVDNEFAHDIGPALIVDTWRREQSIQSLPSSYKISAIPRNASKTWPKLGKVLHTGSDWSLIEIDDGQYTLPNVFSRNIAAEERSGDSSDRMSQEENVYITGFEQKPQRSIVHVLTGRSGPRIGVLSPSETYLKDARGTWAKVLSIHFKTSRGRPALQRGDSGSWVVDADNGLLVGQIVAVSGSVGYVMPIRQLLDEIESAFPESPIGLPRPFDLLADVAHLCFSSQGESNQLHATKYAASAISREVLQASSSSPDVLPLVGSDTRIQALLKALDTLGEEEHPLLMDLIKRTGSKINDYQSLLQQLNTLRFSLSESSGPSKPRGAVLPATTRGDSAAAPGTVVPDITLGDTEIIPLAARLPTRQGEDTELIEEQAQEASIESRKQVIDKLFGEISKHPADRRQDILGYPFPGLSKMSPSDMRFFAAWFLKEAGIEHMGVTLEDMLRAIEASSMGTDEYRATSSFREASEEEHKALHAESKGSLELLRPAINVTMVYVAGSMFLGWEWAAFNGANLIWPSELGLNIKGQARDLWLYALVSAAPALSGAFTGFWLSFVFTSSYGYRSSIVGIGFLYCVAASVVQLAFHNVNALLAWRFVLGIGTGVLWTALPIYWTDCVPVRFQNLSGYLMQIGTSLGALLGLSVNWSLSGVKPSLRWRLESALSAAPVVLLVYSFLLSQIPPESPRYLIRRKRYTQALQSLMSLRQTKLQSLRDLYVMESLELYRAWQQRDHNREYDTRETQVLFTWLSRLKNGLINSSSRRTIALSALLMIAQAVTGFTSIAFSFGVIVRDHGASNKTALILSWVLGLGGFLSSIPFAMLHRYKQGKLKILYSLALGASALLGFGLSIQNGFTTTRLSLATLFGAIFFIAYSAAAGVLRSLYSPQLFPWLDQELLAIISTSCYLWTSGVATLFFLPLTFRIGITATMGIFIGLTVLAIALVLCFVPETGAMTLEELFYLTNIPLRKVVWYHLHEVLPYKVRQILLINPIAAPLPLLSVFGGRRSDQAGQEGYEMDSFS